MKKRIILLPLTMLVMLILACNLDMPAASTLSQEQIDTYSAQTLMFLQWQTHSAQGTQDLPPADTLAPPPATSDNRGKQVGPHRISADRSVDPG